MPVDDFASLAARADLARLLAACYYLPGPEFAEEGLFDSLVSAASGVGPELASLARRLGQAFAASDLQALQVDYTRLFLGPAGAPARPYGSVWLDSRQSLMLDSTQAVLDLYAEADFEIAEDFRDLPDHITAEMEFLYLLFFREAEAIRAGEPAAAARAVSLRRRFLAEHLGRWVEPFAAAQIGHAETDFFRTLATLTERFVSEQAESAKSG
jgi:TorA maturation chaperone TorD